MRVLKEVRDLTSGRMLVCLVALVVMLAVTSPVNAQQRGIGAGGAGAAQPGSKVALVIGNADYPTGRLRNPVNDARAIARALEEVGFNVTLRENLGQRAMEEAIHRFGQQLGPGGVALFYYAGHGLQVKGRNYLVPVGQEIRSAVDLKYEAVDAGRIVDRMEQARSMLNLVVLDACRDDPFRGFRSASSGLAPMTAGEGTIIAYATSPGSVAADGSKSHSPYTEALVSNLRRPGLPVERVFKETAREVKRRAPEQVPWINSSFTGEFYFRPSKTDQGERKPVQVADSPGPALGEVDRRKLKIQRLLKQAEADLAANRLTTPPGNNALAKYQEVLRLNPMIKEANQGLRRVVARYVDLAEGRIKAGDWDSAEKYLERAEKVIEGDGRVFKARTELIGAKDRARKAHAIAEARKREQAEKEREQQRAQLKSEDSIEYREVKVKVQEGYWKTLHNGVSRLWVPPKYEVRKVPVNR